jgi:hypothetical protein
LLLGFFDQPVFVPPQKTGGKMTQLSDYERQRLDNIAANQAHLESLGLAGGVRGLIADKTKITRQPKRKRDDDEDGEAGLVDVRRSSRLCDAPKTYVELSHEDMLREEREMEGMERSTIRPRRACGKPVTFVQKQGEEQEERQKVNTARRSAISQRIAVETKQRHQAASEAREENMRLKQQQRAATQPDVSTLPQPVPPPTAQLRSRPTPPRDQNGSVSFAVVRLCRTWTDPIVCTPASRSPLSVQR